MPALNFHTIELFYIARAAVLRAREDSKRPNALTDDSLVAIVMAASASEAFINELSANLLMYDAAAQDWNPLTESARACAESIRDAEASNARTKDKFKDAAKSIDSTWKGANSLDYQDFGRLIVLRNAIVHMKPEAAERAGAVTEALGKRIKLSGSASLPWVNRIETPEVAEWAVSTARRVVLDLLAMFPDHPIDWIDQLGHFKRSLREFRGLDGDTSRWPD
jgi:hypothetical protein